MNLDAVYVPRPHVEYEFVVLLTERPKDAPPPEVAGPPGSPWVPTIRLTASRPGGMRRGIERRGLWTNESLHRRRGLEGRASSPRQGETPEDLPDPKISTAETGRTAREKGESAGAVATVVSDEPGSVWSAMGLDPSVRLDREGRPRSMPHPSVFRQICDSKFAGFSLEGLEFCAPFRYSRGYPPSFRGANL
ncbi:MAG: hypothetical protein SNJ74_06330 [Fimbriimonadaceae bacterium]